MPIMGLTNVSSSGVTKVVLEPLKYLNIELEVAACWEELKF